MLDFSYNMASNRRMARSDMSEMSILGGIDTKFGYLVRIHPKL